MEIKRLKDFLRNMFEQFRAVKVHPLEMPPRLLPEKGESGTRNPGPADEARGCDRMRDNRLVESAPIFCGHTYLLEESRWLLGGVYINEMSVSVDVEGDSLISYRDGSWFNELKMELKTNDSAEYRNLQYKTVYEYQAIESLQDASAWQGSNALLGRLHGILVFVDDTILSSWQTSNGCIRGMESLRQISESEYQCRGALFETGKRSSSWILRYVKD